MTREPRYHRKGSVIVMVVGLLVLLAMVGTTFIIVAHMDRREAASIATVAPMKQVADGVLQQIRVKLAIGLCIDGQGTADPSDDVIYGSAANYKQQADFSHEDYSKHLASFAPVLVGGVPTWRHLSNHSGVADPGFADVLADDPLLVDTDGYLNDGVNAGDAKLFPSYVSNRGGSKYWVAYRLIDASSLMNVNSAYGPPAAAAAGTVMPITNIALDALTGTGVRDSVRDARRGSTSDNIATYNTNYVQRPLNIGPDGAPRPYLPFDASDMTALLWGGTVPNTASGRLWEALGGQFASAKPYLTVFSASRDYVRRYAGILDMTHRVDLNSTSATVFVDLFNAFYNAVPEGIAGFTDNDNARRIVAAQLAVNIIDYRDAGDTPYEPAPADMATVGLAGVKLFGVERQPFITEAWLRMEWNAGDSNVDQWSAIELFNPYATAVSLAGYRLQVGATTNDLQNLPPGPGNMLPAGGRIVIVNKNAEIQAVNPYQDTNLDLRETCTLFRPAGGSSVPVGSVEFAEFGGLTVPFGPGPAVAARIRRDDTVARAKYSVAVYAPAENYTYRIGDAGCPAPDDTNLGRSNSDVDLGAAVAPTPVFVRNGSLINLGEVSRIFYVGPKSDGTPLDKALALMSPNNVSNGRLYTFGAIKAGTEPTDPQIPPACMLGDYMDVLTPDTNNTGRTDTVYGRININTAPWQVIRYLPGISAMAQRDLIAKDIVAYRDLLDNTADGGHDYSTAGARATVIGLTDLREDAGFASPGEIAIPLARVITPRPRNIYGASAPNCYKVADSGVSDDGLNEITGDLSKYGIYYAWLSNQITVRSDVYIAYIRVQVGSDPAATGAVRKYVAVIDRSNCTSTADLPDVLMFAEMK